jgi:hypothetical protein
VKGRKEGQKEQSMKGKKIKRKKLEGKEKYRKQRNEVLQKKKKKYVCDTGRIFFTSQKTVFCYS